MSAKNTTRKRPTSPIVRTPSSARIGNATIDIRQGYARKSARSPRRDYRKTQHKVTLDMSALNAAKIAELARGLSEFDQLYHQLHLSTDKKELNDMAERYANSNNPNLERMHENIQFWKNKINEYIKKGDIQIGGARKRMTKKRMTRRRRTRKSKR